MKANRPNRRLPPLRMTAEEFERFAAVADRQGVNMALFAKRAAMRAVSRREAFAGADRARGVSAWRASIPPASSKPGWTPAMRPARKIFKSDCPGQGREGLDGQAGAAIWWALMARVEIYSSMWCPFCHRAKRLLKSKGVAFTEINVDGQPTLRSEMMSRSGGRRTVPQIFIAGAHVGGSDELAALERAGRLDAMLEGAAS